MSMVTHPPGLRGAVQAFARVIQILTPWSPSEYQQGCLSCVETIKDVDPDVIILDDVLPQAVDACTLVGRMHAVLVPIGLNELVKYANINRWRYWSYPM